MKNEIYLQKRLKVLVPTRGNNDNRLLVATIAKNFENLGYCFEKKLFTRLATFTESQLTTFYKETVSILRKLRGAHRAFNPMYPNFPQQVLDMSHFELYMNAIRHYWSFTMKDFGVCDEVWLPQYEKDERFPLTEFHKLDVINLGDEKDFCNIFTTLLAAKSSISETDKAIVTWFVENYKNDIINYLPEQIGQKEQLALLAGLLLTHTNQAQRVADFIKTPTDVLRLAVAFSEGDVSLAENTKFRNLKRGHRRFLLSLLDRCKTQLAEEMVKYSNQWIRLGERLHPAEYANQYPNATKAFKTLRDGVKVYTFNSKVESALKNDVEEAVKLLTTRPGDFARRLDHVLRLSEDDRNKFVKKFVSVAEKVSTNVLLQLYTHFKNRSVTNSFRAVFPKGNLAKVHIVETQRAEMNQKFCDKTAGQIRKVLVSRFGKLDKVGKVYLDEQLKDFLVPFSQRSASKALKTIVRGSKLELDGDYDTIRFFIWWKNGTSRTDIDLSACILDENWNHKAHISYYNLRDFGGHHSGDITDAPRGASEFIDISLNQVLQRGGRYVVMTVNSFTQQPYCDLPECFAGWMGRQKPNSGEIYEPKTVKNKIDLASDTGMVIPMVIDALTRKVIWLDLTVNNTNGLFYANNAANKTNSISLICKALSDLKKPNLYDLLSMHVDGRGKLVSNKKDADVVFSAETTPFEIDKIVSDYL